MRKEDNVNVERFRDSFRNTSNDKRDEQRQSLRDPVDRLPFPDSIEPRLIIDKKCEFIIIVLYFAYFLRSFQ